MVLDFNHDYFIAGGSYKKSSYYCPFWYAFKFDSTTGKLSLLEDNAMYYDCTPDDPTTGPFFAIDMIHSSSSQAVFAVATPRDSSYRTIASDHFLLFKWKLTQSTTEDSFFENCYDSTDTDTYGKRVFVAKMTTHLNQVQFLKPISMKINYVGEGGRTLSMF